MKIKDDCNHPHPIIKILFLGSLQFQNKSIKLKKIYIYVISKSFSLVYVKCNKYPLTNILLLSCGVEVWGWGVRPNKHIIRYYLLILSTLGL